ncbi:hypothetical protein ACP275_03G027200 [Erythranthe tilingii]
MCISRSSAASVSSPSSHIGYINTYLGTTAYTHELVPTLKCYLYNQAILQDIQYGSLAAIVNNKIHHCMQAPDYLTIFFFFSSKFSKDSTSRIMMIYRSPNGRASKLFLE